VWGGSFSSSSQRLLAQQIGMGNTPGRGEEVPPCLQLPPLEVGRALVPPELPGPHPANHPAMQLPPRITEDLVLNIQAIKLLTFSWASLPRWLRGHGAMGAPVRAPTILSSLVTMLLGGQGGPLRDPRGSLPCWGPVRFRSQERRWERTDIPAMVLPHPFGDGRGRC